MRYPLDHNNAYQKLFCECIGCRNWRIAAEKARNEKAETPIKMLRSLE